MLSHVKSGAIYHNYSISPNFSSSFFDFSSLSLSFRRFMPQFCGTALCVMAPLPQLCRPARRVYRPSFPSFPEPLRPCRPPLPARIVRHEPTYRMIRAFVSYVTWPRALRYELLTLISSFAAGLAGRAREDGGVGGGMTRPAKAANGCLPWILAGGHRALLTHISPFGTPIYSLRSDRDNLGRVDIYQKYNHFVNFFRSFAF